VQQEVIRLLVDHIVVGENEIVIKHIIPTDDDCRLLPGHMNVRRCEGVNVSDLPIRHLPIFEELTCSCGTSPQIKM